MARFPHELKMNARALSIAAAAAAGCQRIIIQLILLLRSVVAPPPQQWQRLLQRSLGKFSLSIIYLDRSFCLPFIPFYPLSASLAFPGLRLAL